MGLGQLLLDPESGARCDLLMRLCRVTAVERPRTLDVFDRAAFGHHLYELPGDCAQLYLRDPGSNLVEIDAPKASGLPADLPTVTKRLADVHSQDPENLRATQFLGSPPPGS